ncbi:hypothetical protein QVD17_04189 [Tagetes erecta]|uniref:Uncharacterized protein n=1 Tax=Tagetes erecta TaxID=13708 RepID=A0AAD8LFU8_TARER|nr:hypothetical protein QVD17_04189 [Tagetes erecta]
MFQHTPILDHILQEMERLREINKKRVATNKQQNPKHPRSNVDKLTFLKQQQRSDRRYLPPCTGGAAAAQPLH